MKARAFIMATRADNNLSTAPVEGPRALRPSEHAAAITLLNSVLRPDGPPTILQEYPLVLGRGNLKNMRAIVQGDTVLCHAAVYFSILRAGDLAFKVGGVGSVATHPSCRGQGLASRVVRDCIRLAEEHGCHLSVLWTQRPDFYRRLGYETAGSEYLFQARASDFAEIDCKCAVAPFDSNHVADIMRIHERETLRTERTVEEYETYFGLPKAKTLVAIRGDRVTAYAVMGKGEDFQSCIHEWGGMVEDLLCLVRELATDASGEKVLILVPLQKKGLTERLLEMRIPASFEYLAMIKAINLESLGAMLRDPFQNLTGREFRLNRRGAFVRMKVGAEEIAIEREQDLVRFLFGPETPSQILRGLSDNSLSALEQLFPVPLFIWGLDSV